MNAEKKEAIRLPNKNNYIEIKIIVNSIFTEETTKIEIQSCWSKEALTCDFKVEDKIYPIRQINQMIIEVFLFGDSYCLELK